MVIGQDAQVARGESPVQGVLHDGFRVPLVRWRPSRLSRATVAGLMLFLLPG